MKLLREKKETSVTVRNFSSVAPGEPLLGHDVVLFKPYLNLVTDLLLRA